MQLVLFFKIGYVSQRGGQEQDCSQFLLVSCDEMGDYFAIEADTMIDIVRVT